MTSDPLRFGENRPSPDALLEQAERETRGRLKIFLGAAPGVGKTYEMLMSGRARKADGIDVVIGIVETHGRAETEALTEGLEIIPRARCISGSSTRRNGYRCGSGAQAAAGSGR